MIVLAVPKGDVYAANQGKLCNSPGPERTRDLGITGHLQSFFNQGNLSPRASLWALQGTALR